MPKVFLDKIMTSAHLPPQRGSTGYTSTTTLPDLSHTLVHTEYAPAIIQAMTPKGQMTRTFKAYGHKLAREVERPRSEMKRKVKFFRRAHNVFANKILLDMQKNIAAKNERRERIWRDGKIEYGFDHLEGGVDNNTKSHESMIGTSNTLKGFATIGASNGNKREGDGFLFDTNFSNEIEAPPIMFPDEYGDGDFETPENEGNNNRESDGMGGGLIPSSASSFERPPTSASHNKTDGRPTTSALRAGGRGGSNPPTASVRFDSTTTTGTSGATARPGTSASGTRNSQGTDPAAVMVPDMGIPPPGSRVQSSRNNNTSTTLTELSLFTTDSEYTTATAGAKRRKKKKGFASDNRKRKPYNRSTFFECVYDTLEVPPPHAPRFGMMSSPERPASGAGIIKSRYATVAPMMTLAGTLSNSAPSTSMLMGPGNSEVPTALTQMTAVDSIVSRISSTASRKSRGAGQPGGMDRWSHAGVRRAMYGETWGAPKDYR